VAIGRSDSIITGTTRPSAATVGHVELDVAVLNPPLAEQLLQDLLHLPTGRRRPAGGGERRPGATHGEREERETDAVRKERREEPDIRHQNRKPHGPASLPIAYPVSHFCDA